MDCVIPTFDILTEDQIKRINENSYIIKHKKDELIFRQNTPISYTKFVKSGLVKIYKETDNEKKIIIRIISPGNFISLNSVFFKSLYQFSATSLEVSEVIYTNINVFKEIIIENGQYASFIMNLMSIDSMELLQKVISITQKQIPGRLADVLLFFANQIYNNTTFNLPISRIELAELISTTKESVSRVLTEFKNDRIIEIEDKNVTIKSYELLNILSKLG